MSPHSVNQHLLQATNTWDLVQDTLEGENAFFYVCTFTYLHLLSGSSEMRTITCIGRGCGESDSGGGRGQG